MEEYPFSVGGNDLRLAMELIPDVVPYRFEEEKSKKVNEGDLFSSKFDRQELKAIINDLNEQPIFDMAVRRAYKFLVSLLDNEDKEEMGLNEQMYIDDDEFEMEMGRSKKDSLKKEMMIHVDQLIDGNIDMNDFMNVVEEIMAEVKSLKEEIGLNESIPALEKMNNLINALRFNYMQLEKGNIDKDDFINAVEELAFGERRAPGMQEEDAIEDEPVTEDMFGPVKFLKSKGISDEMISDFMKMHSKDIVGASEDEIMDEFENFRSVNYDYIDEDLKAHFNRFK